MRKRAVYGSGLRAATRLAQNWAVSRMRTRVKKRGTSGRGITNQYDKGFIYRKKRMPYGRKKKWINFSRRVKAVIDKGLGTRSIVFNETITTSVTTGQTLAYAHLYSLVGQPSGTNNNESACNDLGRMIVRDDNSNASKIHFKSAIMDLTFNGYPDDSTNNSPMEVDVYEIMWKKNNYPGDFNAYLALQETQTPTLTGYPFGLTLGNRGVTPFEIPLLARGGMRIIKKTKYFLSRGGSTFTYQIRDPKNRYFSAQKLSSEASNTEFCLGGWTRTIMFIIKTVPGADPGIGNGVSIGVTRSYAYSKNEQNEVGDGLL